ncbi:hypothetical protein KM043_008269 [Ampulex compressa]|nr:hypothetical protein KM043_008269 [Ampulex compressa]
MKRTKTTMPDAILRNRAALPEAPRTPPRLGGQREKVRRRLRKRPASHAISEVEAEVTCVNAHERVAAKSSTDARRARWRTRSNAALRRSGYPLAFSRMFDLECRAIDALASGDRASSVKDQRVNMRTTRKPREECKGNVRKFARVRRVSPYRYKASAVAG